MSWYKICHDNARYDIVCDWGIHRCTVCGSKWYCVLPDWRKPGAGFEPTWVEGWSWTRLRRLLHL